MIRPGILRQDFVGQDGGSGGERDAVQKISAGDRLCHSRFFVVIGLAHDTALLCEAAQPGLRSGRTGGGGE